MRGVPVKPYLRLADNQVSLIHRGSMKILMDPGVLVYSEEAADIFDRGGAVVSAGGCGDGSWTVKIPEKMVWAALETAPRKIRLGARDPKNALDLDGKEPRLYFGSGSESNFFLETKLEAFVKKDDPSCEAVFPTYTKRRGKLADLCAAARLGENLEHLDFFIRPVNVQDEDIHEYNKDVNKFFACLDNITKHVMSGLTDLGQLDNVINMAEIIAGGKEKLRKNPLISFITCVTKSPLQLVGDAAARMLAVNRLKMPVVISSSPQGGSTAPIEETGIVMQINAEILSAVVLSQLAAEGAPVIYGSVPVRARMDNLHDMYGAPEFNQYNVSCIQMARYYGLPCYSTGGVADAKVPGIQAAVEKMFSHLYVSRGGPHLLHYAFGLLEETQTFCPEQAVLDNEHIGMVKLVLQEPEVDEEQIKYCLDVVRKTMQTPQRLFARYARKRLHSGKMYLNYPFEGGEERDETMLKVKEETDKLLSMPSKRLPEEIRNRIFAEVPGLVERLR